MRRRSKQGASAIEFAFSLLILIPTLLGVMGIGFSMLHQLQVIQLGRDAGSMYARKTDFTSPGAQKLLSQVAGSLGLTASTVSSTTGGTAGSTVVILSAIQYVNASLCGQASPPLAPDAADCPNIGNWVFGARIVVGNKTVAASNLGAPDSTVTIAPNGTITISQMCLKPGDKVTGYNPWTSATITNANNALSTIQSQPIYVSEATAYGFRLPPFSSGTKVSSQVFF